MNRKRTMWILAGLTVLLMSLPFLVEGFGWTALFGLVPLLCMERIATEQGIRRFWLWHYGTFVVWNAVTTWWIWNATPGGAIFAILANSFQMSLIFGVFRWSRKRLGGALPYIFLAAMWIAWERFYLVSAEISWPWLVFGNAFAGTTPLIQWYEYTGSLGGSLWVWTVNLAVFGIMVTLSDGRWHRFWPLGRVSALAATVLALFGPMALSLALLNREEPQGESIDVVIAQPNFDPYAKFGGLSRDRQNAILLDLFRRGLKSFGAGAGIDRSPGSSPAGARPVLLVAPETFTPDVITNDVPSGRTFNRFRSFLLDYPASAILFGASSHTYIESPSKPSHTARPAGPGRWRESHNSALICDAAGNYDIYHKSKLVVGTELTPYPAIFCPIDDLLGGVMGRCVGQEEPSNLRFCAVSGDTVSVAPVICYESVYGEYCTGYVRKGASVLAIITNDAWWGNTAGHRQHLNYARLRAIETRRDIIRCANTGISAFIDCKGNILERTPWWESAILTGSVPTRARLTGFVRWGDIPGRISVLVFLLLGAAALFRRRK